jgi:uncharacterized protein (TIGR03545 family)
MKLFRPTGIIILAVLAILLWLLSYIWINGWLADVLEEQGSQLNGATVSADEVAINWLNSGLHISQLALADPDNLSQNRLQLDSLDFDLSLTALLKQQFHVDRLAIENLKVNVPRTHPAQRVERSLSKPASWQWPKAVVEKTQEINTSDLLARVQIKSPRMYQQFLNELEQKKQQWLKSYDELPDEQTIARLKADYEQAKERLEKAKGLEKITAAKDLKEVVKRAKQEKDKVSQFRREVADGADEIKLQWQAIKQQLDKDVHLAMSMASLSPEGMKHLAANLLGESASDWVGLLFAHLDKVKKLAAPSKPQQAQPPLRKGIDIPLVQEQLAPDFWIKDTQISGVFQFGERQGKVAGKVTNLANKLITGAPTQGDIELTLEQGGQTATGHFQFAVQHPQEHLPLFSANLQLKQWPLADWSLASNQLTLAEPKASLKLSATADSEGESVNMALQLTDFKVKNVKGEAEGWVAHLVEILQKSPRIELTIDVQQQGDRTNFSLTSNLDTLFLAKIKDELRQRADKVKMEVRQTLEQQLKPLQQKIEQQLGSILDIEQALDGRLEQLRDVK